MNVREDLIEKISGRLADQWCDYGDQATAELVVDTVMADYRVEPHGTPIHPSNVRVGDYIRIEHLNGRISEYSARGRLDGDFPGKVYLIDRPDPDGDFAFPGQDGAVIRLEPKNSPQSRTVASREDGDWYVAGMSWVYTPIELREKFCNFEVLSDGNDQ